MDCVLCEGTGKEHLRYGGFIKCRRCDGDGTIPDHLVTDQECRFWTAPPKFLSGMVAMKYARYATVSDSSRLRSHSFLWCCMYPGRNLERHAKNYQQSLQCYGGRYVFVINTTDRGCSRNCGPLNNAQGFVY